MEERKRKCGRETCKKQIPENMPFCCQCQIELNKEGLCAYCGKSPRKPKTLGTGGTQSKYCEPCKKIISDLYGNKSLDFYTKKYRGTGVRENTRETKYGTDR